MYEFFIGLTLAMVLWFFTTLGLNLDDAHAGIKALLLMTSFFLIPLFVNLAVKFAEANSADQVIIDNLNLVYTTVVYIDYFMIFYFGGYLVYVVYKIIKKNTKNSLKT